MEDHIRDWQAIRTSGAPVIDDWIMELAGMTQDVDAAALIDRIRALEALKGAAAAAQARAAVAFESARRAAHVESGLPADNVGRGVAAEIALARRDSPHRGARHLGFAKALVTEMPHTLRQLTAGRLSEWRATLLVRETACLDVEHRAVVDEALVADADSLDGMGDRRLVMEAKRWACRLDPESAVRRSRKAENDRTVTCRPAPDTMTYLTGLLPVAQGVAVYAALQHEAEALRARGDSRGRGQLMADILVEKVTGRTQSAPAKIEVQLVMTDRTLLRGSSEPALLPGYGVVPAPWARRLIGRHVDPGSDPIADVWIRRLYTAPATDSLVTMDSRARLFPPGLRRLLRVRDHTCRTPWCDAPIRHHDHVLAHAAGGPTSAFNGQGLCERCNHAKESPGWHSSTVSEVPHAVRIVTPTGHDYRSAAPSMPGDAVRRASGARRSQGVRPSRVSRRGRGWLSRRQSTE